MNSKTGFLIGGIILVVLLIRYWHEKQVHVVAPSAPPATGGQSSVSEIQPGNEAFTAPYMSTNPGIADSPVLLNGGQAFQSTINVSVNSNVAQMLAHQYMPLFGFVGVVAVGGMQ